MVESADPKIPATLEFSVYNSDDNLLWSYDIFTETRTKTQLQKLIDDILHDDGIHDEISQFWASALLATYNNFESGLHQIDWGIPNKIVLIDKDLNTYYMMGSIIYETEDEHNTRKSKRYNQ